MELIIFKAQVSKLKNGSKEPNVDWSYANLITAGSVLYNVDKSECICFIKSEKVDELTAVLNHFGFVILNGTEKENELSNYNYKYYLLMVEINNPDYKGGIY